jgi:plastocyanin
MGPQEAAMHRSRVTVPGLLAIALVVLACSGAGAPGATETASTAASTTSATTSATSAPTLAPPSQAVARITPLPGAPDSGLSITLVAAHGYWSVSALTVPAGQVWHLILDNEDNNVPHNFVIAHRPELQATIFGPKFDGIATMTFDIPGLPAGTYQFICSLHPETMTGVLTIK